MTSKRKSVLLTLSLGLGTLLLVGGVALAQVFFLGVDKKATLSNNDTVATITGSVSCAPGEPLDVNAIIQQNHSGTNVAGSGDTPGLVCTGSSQPFSVQVQVLNPPNATFKKGPASAIVGANTPGGSQTVTVQVNLSE